MVGMELHALIVAQDFAFSRIAVVVGTAWLHPPATLEAMQAPRILTTRPLGASMATLALIARNFVPLIALNHIVVRTVIAWPPEREHPEAIMAPQIRKLELSFVKMGFTGVPALLLAQKRVLNLIVLFRGNACLDRRATRSASVFD